MTHRYRFPFVCLLSLMSVSVFILSCKKPSRPDVQFETGDVTDIEFHSARISGSVIDDGGIEILQKGIVISKEPVPVISWKNFSEEGPGTGSFTSYFSSLSINTYYYYRPYTKYKNGTSYGEIKKFRTGSYYETGDGVTDIDGNFYPTILLGNQEWTIWSLATTRFRNGDYIPTSSEKDDWELASQENQPLYYWGYYNWHALIDDRQLCPEGWHVPTLDDVLEMFDYLGGAEVAGGKMKKPCQYWDMHEYLHQSAGATNESGLNMSLYPYWPWPQSSYPPCMPNAYYWIVENEIQTQPTCIYLDFRYREASIVTFLTNKGTFVRCVKDSEDEK